MACLVVGLSWAVAANASANIAVQNSPSSNAILHTDRPATFTWDFGDQSDDPNFWNPTRLLLKRGQVVQTFQTQTTYFDIAAGQLAAGRYSWQVCQTDAAAVSVNCSGERMFTLRKAPKLNRATAKRQVRLKLRRKWNGRVDHVRCVRSNAQAYMCSMRWHNSRVKYRGKATVWLIDHRFKVDAYVLSRVRR